jgi:hypothetical protein
MCGTWARCSLLAPLSCGVRTHMQSDVSVAAAATGVTTLGADVPLFLCFVSCKDVSQCLLFGSSSKSKLAPHCLLHPRLLCRRGFPVPLG